MSDLFRQGLTSLNQTIRVDHVPVQGSLPFWLEGTLLRNGPGRFEVGAHKFRHWFDGQAMLHKFSFRNGMVSYACRPLESKSSQAIQKQGKICYKEFATDPCRSLFKRMTTLFTPEFSDNTNVSILKLKDRFLALTETPLPVEFDPETLKTINIHVFRDHFPSGQTTPHPHVDIARQCALNHMVTFGLKTSYRLYHIHPNLTRSILSEFPVKEPSYMHSFGLTEHFIILVEFPFFMHPFKIAMRNKPLVDHLIWKPERATSFLVLDRRTGQLIQRYWSEAFFAFHHINAFEKDHQIYLDIAAYPDTSIISDFFLTHLCAPHGGRLAQGSLRRYRLPLKQSNKVPISFEIRCPESIELPTINYEHTSTHEYSYVYGVSQQKQKPEDFHNQLVKADVQRGTAQTWYEEDCYPGEPIFVPHPKCQAEDDGVVLSVVLDGRNQRSFLLVLDGQSFHERARAEVSHHIPFGFHGIFVPFSNTSEFTTPIHTQEESKIVKTLSIRRSY